MEGRPRGPGLMNKGLKIALWVVGGIIGVPVALFVVLLGFFVIRDRTSGTGAFSQAAPP
jgi:hypothetical protein